MMYVLVRYMVYMTYKQWCEPVLVVCSTLLPAAAHAVIPNMLLLHNTLTDNQRECVIISSDMLCASSTCALQRWRACTTSHHLLHATYLLVHHMIRGTEIMYAVDQYIHHVMHLTSTYIHEIQRC